MNDVAAAVFLAQSVVDRAYIEEQQALRTRRIGGLEQRGRWKISENKRNPARSQRRRRGRRIVFVIELHVLEREALVQELAGRVVVVDRELCAGNPVVLGRYVEERNARLRLWAAEIADLDVDRIGRGRCPREQDGPGQQKADHRNAPSDGRAGVG